MTIMIRPVVRAAALAGMMAGSSFALAQAPATTDPHHPAAAPGTAQAAPPAAPGAVQPGAGGMMMGGDMGRMMQMMPMMQARMAASTGPMGLQHYRRIEGRLAYIRTELRITEAQAAPWNGFADAMRSQTERLRQAAMPAMQAPAQPSPAPPTALQQMERRIAALSAHLEAMRAVAAAAEPLYAVLSQEQRRTADELMAEHGRGTQMGRMY